MLFLLLDSCAVLFYSSFLSFKFRFIFVWPEVVGNYTLGNFFIYFYEFYLINFFLISFEDDTDKFQSMS